MIELVSRLRKRMCEPKDKLGLTFLRGNGYKSFAVHRALTCALAAVSYKKTKINIWKPH